MSHDQYEPSREDILDHTQTRTFQAFNRSKRFTVKVNSYFAVYERILSRFVGKEFTFVEIGVLDGGSLYMWREFFGDKARIIGIDISPESKNLEEEGFEIFVGDQADPEFWRGLFDKVGMVDVVLDDGGHLFRQQIITAECVIPHIKDNGMLFVEDTHTSYMKEFAGPSRRSFLSYAFNIVKGINYRFAHFTPPRYREGMLLRRRVKAERAVYSVWFFDSIIVFNIDRLLAGLESQVLSNLDNTGVRLVKDRRYRKDFLVRVFGRKAMMLSNFVQNQLLGKYFRY